MKTSGSAAVGSVKSRSRPVSSAAPAHQAHTQRRQTVGGWIEAAAAIEVLVAEPQARGRGRLACRPRSAGDSRVAVSAGRSSAAAQAWRSGAGAALAAPPRLPIELGPRGAPGDDRTCLRCGGLCSRDDQEPVAQPHRWLRSAAACCHLLAPLPRGQALPRVRPPRDEHPTTAGLVCRRPNLAGRCDCKNSPVRSESFIVFGQVQNEGAHRSLGDLLFDSSVRRRRSQEYFINM